MPRTHNGKKVTSFQGGAKNVEMWKRWKRLMQNAQIESDALVVVALYE